MLWRRPQFMTRLKVVLEPTHHGCEVLVGMVTAWRLRPEILFASLSPAILVRFFVPLSSSERTVYMEFKHSKDWRVRLKILFGSSHYNPPHRFVYHTKVN
jgi:hypothetical protein